MNQRLFILQACDFQQGQAVALQLRDRPLSSMTKIAESME